MDIKTLINYALNRAKKEKFPPKTKMVLQKERSKSFIKNMAQEFETHYNRIDTPVNILHKDKIL